MNEEISHNSILLPQKENYFTPFRQYILIIEITYNSRTSSAELKIHITPLHIGIHIKQLLRIAI